ISAGQFGYGVYVLGGTVSVSGGVQIVGNTGVLVNGGTASIAGGSIRGGPGAAVLVWSGAASISGGSFSWGYSGVIADNGGVDVFGCNLVMDGNKITGTLEDGTSIDLPTSGLTADNLHNHLPQLTAPANITVPTDPNSCTATLNPGTATVTGSDCGSIPTVTGARSVNNVNDNKKLSDPYLRGTTPNTWTATDSFDQKTTAEQTVTALDTHTP